MKKDEVGTASNRQTMGVLQSLPQGNCKKHILFALYLVFISFTAQGVQKENFEKISIESCVRDKFFIIFAVQNNNELDVIINKSLLPWGVMSSTNIAALVDDSNFRRMEMYYFPDDPGDLTLNLKPNEKISGEIDLRRRIKGISAAVFDSNIILIVRHDLFDVNNKKLATYRKMHSISRKGIEEGGPVKNECT